MSALFGIRFSVLYLYVFTLCLLHLFFVSTFEGFTYTFKSTVIEFAFVPSRVNI